MPHFTVKHSNILCADATEPAGMGRVIVYDEITQKELDKLQKHLYNTAF